MALRGTEGFDHYADFSDAATRLDGITWSATVVSPTIVTPGRNGVGKCLSIPATTGASGYATAGLTFGGVATLFCGFGLECVTTGAGLPDSVAIALTDPTDSNVVQCSVGIVISTGVVSLYRGTVAGGTLLASSAAAAFDPALFPGIEIMATIDPSSGAIAVRIAGNPAVSIADVNTQAGANSRWGAISFSCISASSTGAALIDDFRYNDTAVGPGPYPFNGWIGDVRIATLFAISNDIVNWTPLAGTNWQEISETAFDGDASYNFSPRDGTADRFNLGSLTGVIDQILAVQIVGGYRQYAGAASGGRPLTQQLTIDGATVSGGIKAMGDVYHFYADVMTARPATETGLTLADINAMRVGYTALPP